MSEFNFPAFLIQGGSFWKIPEPVKLGSQDELIHKVGQSMPVTIPLVAILNGSGVGLQFLSGQVTAWTEIKILPINTVYTVAGDGTRYPLFKKKPLPGSSEHEASFDFVPELAVMRLFFASTMVYVKEESLWVWSTSFLVSKAPKRKEIFRPPLPNIYSDARLCMGNDYSNSGTVLMDVFANSLAQLQSSRWNSDLMEGMDGGNIRAMYSFKDGKQQAPPKGYKWWEQASCAPVNLEQYGNLPLV